MHFLTALTVIPAAVLAYCPTDFSQNATMAEGPCRSLPTPIIISALPSHLARISFSNGTTLKTGDFRLWDDKAYNTVIEAAPVSKLRGAIGLASKMDLGFYAPVCAGEGVCGKKAW
jgi:hypothetical protein